MKAVDTNVLARFIVRDDTQQAAISDAILRAGAHISLTVLLETAWLLKSRYALSATVIATTLAEVLDLPSVSIDDLQAVRWALRRSAEGADIADMIHLAAANPIGTFVTFDQGIAQGVGKDCPVTIETLAA